MTTCKEIEIDKLFEQFKEEAKTALNAFGVYRWQYEKFTAHCAVPKIENAFDFLHEYGYEEFTVSDLLKEIFRQCDGKNNGNAKLITIEYMSEVIAHWETKAFLNER